MTLRRRRSFSEPSVRKSIPLVCCQASSTVWKPWNSGGWEVFDVVGEAHFVEDSEKLGRGGKGDAFFAVNVGPESISAVLGRVPVEDDEDAFLRVIG